jgi:hypothetical protein
MQKKRKLMSFVGGDLKLIERGGCPDINQVMQEDLRFKIPTTN